MPPPVLATVQQLEARLGQTVDAVRATALLEDASAVARGYTGQHFTRVLNDKATLRVDRGRVVLPQRPAEKPSSISEVGGGVLPVSAWWWSGVGVVEFGSPAWLANGPTVARFPRTVEVTYTHGYTEIPGDVVAVVCQMVGRVIVSEAAPGLMSESIDDYQYRLGGGIVSGAVALVPAERDALDRYRTRTRSVGLR